MDQSFISIYPQPRGGQTSNPQISMFEETFLYHFLRNSGSGPGGPPGRGARPWSGREAGECPGPGGQPAHFAHETERKKNPASYFIWRRSKFTETGSVLENKHMAAFWEWEQHRNRRWEGTCNSRDTRSRDTLRCQAECCLVILSTRRHVRAHPTVHKVPNTRHPEHGGAPARDTENDRVSPKDGSGLLNCTCGRGCRK